MKTLIGVVVLVLVTTMAFADDQSAARMHRGSVKIWIGSVLMGAGAILVPVTATKGHAGPTHDALPVTGVGIAGVGTGILWWGVTEQRHAASPQTTVGVALGRTNAVQVRRRW